MRVRYTRAAAADLDNLLEYITNRSPQGGRRVRERLRAVVSLLAQHPQIGTLTDDPKIRRMTALPYPYLIFYEATGAEIIVHAIRHVARDPSSMPAQR